MARGLVATVLVVGLAAPASAGLVYREGFDGEPGARGIAGKFFSSPGGIAWSASKGGRGPAEGARVVLPGLGASLERGTIEMWIRRGERMNPEALFHLTDARLGGLAVFQVYWDGFYQKDESEIVIEGGRRSGLWGRTEIERSDGVTISTVRSVPLGRKVRNGEWVHLAFTWGLTSGENMVLVDGRPLSAGVTDASAMGGLMGDAHYLFVGMEVPGREKAFPPQKGWSLVTSAIDEFRLYDTVETDTTLGSVDVASIASVEHDADRTAGFSGSLVAGDVMTVTAEGTAGAAPTFDVVPIADLRGELEVSWKGWGVYLEEITFFEEDQVDLGDVEEYRVYVGTEPFGEITLETEVYETLEVEEQSLLVEGLEFEAPTYVAVMALMDDDRLLPVIEPDQGIAMTEVEGTPGTYQGTWTVDYQDRYVEAVAVARAGSGEGAVSLVGEETFAVDPSLKIEVLTSAEELKADEESTAEIEVTVTDANGDPVSGHEVRFVLATTSQYTGVVGGGSFTDEVGGSLSRDFWGETDLFGQVTATYTAGFAAKTAIVVARDMESNDIGTGFVKTYIEATAQLELEAVQEVAGKALGYTITVTSSDEWLTADGESTARITALVAQNGIPVEGHRVSFQVASGTGKIRTVDGETGSDGKARAVYTAGKKIGIVLITATDQTVGITGSVQIELRSDAPAKIAITLTPDLLPADGRSTADIEVVVTDINDNPNEDVEVEYEVEIGSGRLRRIDEVTDSRGESTAEYVAGRVPGAVSIKVTVRSTEPTEEEMIAAEELATAVTDYDFF